MVARITARTSRSVFLLGALLLLTLFLVDFGWWRGTAVGPQVQVPMFYDDHYIYPRPWTQVQEAPGVPEPAPVAALYGSNHLSQSFTSAADRLSLVELWLAGPAGARVELSLAAEDGSVYGGVVSLDEGGGRRYRFSLPAISPARGRRFVVTLAAPGATAEQPVVTRAVGGDRLGSSLLINEYSRPGNLELYAYGRGRPGRWWLDTLAGQLLPAVFRLRLQQYKPDWLKGDVFAALLILTALASTVFFLLSAVSGREESEARKPTVTILNLAMGSWVAFLLWQWGSGRLLIPGLIRTVPLQAQQTALAVAPAPNGQPRLVQELSQALWTATRKPEARFVSAGLVEGRPAITVPADSSLEYPLTVPLDGRLRLGMMVQGSDELRFTVLLGEQLLHSRVVSVADGIHWLDLELHPWGGQAGSLSLQTEHLDGRPTGYWIMPQLLSSSGWLVADPLPADLPIRPAGDRFGDTVELAGYQIEEAAGQLAVILYWRLLAPSDAHATVFVHLLDESGHILAQHDGQPVNGTYPLPAWQEGVLVADRHVLPLPAGPYRLAVGLYDPATLARWPVTGANGDPLPDGAAFLR